MAGRKFVKRSDLGPVPDNNLAVVEDVKKPINHPKPSLLTKLMSYLNNLLSSLSPPSPVLEDTGTQINNSISGVNSVLHLAAAAGNVDRIKLLLKMKVSDARLLKHSSMIYLFVGFMCVCVRVCEIHPRGKLLLGVHLILTRPIFGLMGVPQSR